MLTHIVFAMPGIVPSFLTIKLLKVHNRFITAVKMNFKISINVDLRERPDCFLTAIY